MLLFMASAVYDCDLHEKSYCLNEFKDLRFVLEKEVLDYQVFSFSR